MQHKLKNYLTSIVLATATIFTQPTLVSADDTKQETTLDDLTQTEVDTLMQRQTVDDILKEEYDSGRIKKVEYKDGKTNFRDLVYQENLPATQRKPVIMLVASGGGKGWFDKEKYEFDKADAIDLKAKSRKFKDVKFVVYDPSVDPNYKEIAEGSFKLGNELKAEGVLSEPSMILYSLVDGAKGETNAQNNGIIKCLDILRGGPVKQGILKFFRNTNNWVSSNFLGNNEYAWRTNNTAPVTWIKVYLQSVH